MKIRPLGATTPLTAALPTAPVFRLIVPRELSGHLGGLGQTTGGAFAALHGAIAVYTVPTLNEPVIASTVLALESVVYSEPWVEVTQALSSTGLEIFRTCRFVPLAPEKISSWSAWASNTKSPANADELDGTTPFESGSVSARVTFWPAFGALTPVAVALAAKNGATAEVLFAEFSVTAYTAGADAGGLPLVPGEDALIRILPPITAT